LKLKAIEAITNNAKFYVGAKVPQYFVNGGKQVPFPKK